jgi:hypothetical protein
MGKAKRVPLAGLGAPVVTAEAVRYQGQSSSTGDIRWFKAARRAAAADLQHDAEVCS